MAQFTPQTLSRLLLNVDRNVLREAATEADLWDVFSSFEREALTELGRQQNLIANLKLLGPSALSVYGEEFFETVELIAGDAPIIPQLLFSAARRTWTNINDLRTLIEFIFKTQEREAPPLLSTEVDILIAVLKTDIDYYLSLPHADYHPLDDADRRLNIMLGRLALIVEHLAVYRRATGQLD